MNSLVQVLVNSYWLHLSGRPGKGKTALGIYLGLSLVANGYAQYIAINTPLYGVGELVAELEDAEQLKEEEWSRTAIILDEAQMYVGNNAHGRKNAESWLSFMRKRDSYLIMPAVLDLTAQASSFYVEQELNLIPFGLPLWIYKWQYKSKAQRDGDRFFWWFPQRVFPLYDHKAKPLNYYCIYKVADDGQATENNPVQDETIPGFNEGVSIFDYQELNHVRAGGSGDRFRPLHLEFWHRGYRGQRSTSSRNSADVNACADRLGPGQG